MIFRIEPSDAERLAGSLSENTLNQALVHFRSDGAFIFDGLVDVPVIEHARRAFTESYADDLQDGKSDERLMVGDRRLMLPLKMEPPFDDQRLFANPWITPILNGILGEDYVIDSYGVVCSLPGAQTQHTHRDGGLLFPESGIDLLLPTVAVLVGIPLLDMNEVNGTTELWPGSHRNRDSVAEKQGIKPCVPQGSCTLWDYRLLHRGTEHRGSAPRPLLYITYARPWFVDYGYYDERSPKQRRIIASPERMSGLSDLAKRMLVRARWNY